MNNSPSSIGKRSMIGIHYENNGTGRDSYIHNNNGGFTLRYEPTVFNKPSSISLGNKFRHRGNAGNEIQSKPIHYRQNGTGRDGYIAVNQGGFMSSNPAGQAMKQRFESQLRGYERSNKKTFGNADMTPSMNRSRSPLSPRSFGGGTKILDDSHLKIPYQQAEQDYFISGQNIITDKRSIYERVQLGKEQGSLNRKLSQPKFSALKNDKILSQLQDLPQSKSFFEKRRNTTLQHPQYNSRNQMNYRNQDSPLKEVGNVLMNLADIYGTLTPKKLAYIQNEYEHSKIDKRRNKYIENQVTRNRVFEQERRRQSDTMMAAHSVKHRNSNQMATYDHRGSQNPSTFATPAVSPSASGLSNYQIPKRNTRNNFDQPQSHQFSMIQNPIQINDEGIVPFRPVNASTIKAFKEQQQPLLTSMV